MKVLKNRYGSLVNRNQLRTRKTISPIDSRFTLDAIVVLFIPKDVMCSSAAVMNTLRIIGSAIGPIISGVIMQIFLTGVIIDGEEQDIKLTNVEIQLRIYAYVPRKSIT